MNFRSLVFALSLALLSARPARADLLSGLSATPLAQAPREILSAVRVNAFLDKDSAKKAAPGERSLYVRVEIETFGKYHIYEDRLAFRSDGWQLRVLETPTPESFLDPVSKSIRRGYHGQNAFVLKLEPDPATTPWPPNSSTPLPLVVAFQSCNERLCLLPIALQVDVPLTYKDTADTTANTAAPGAASGSGLVESVVNRIQRGLAPARGGAAVAVSASMLLILFFAGLLTALTPCVYPLYPITLGIFSRWSAHARVSPLALVLSYCVGLTLSYAVLGLVSAATGSVFGSLTQTPAFLIGTGVLMLVSAVFFSGLLNFPMPQRLLNIFSGSAPAATGPQSSLKLVGQALSMGAGLGVVASPCVGPVLVVILAWLGSAVSQSQGAYVKGFLLLSVFGMGMSLPILILGLLILKLKNKPNFGRYTPITKHIGTALIAGAGVFFVAQGAALTRKAPAAATPVAYEVHSFDTWTRSQWTVFDFRADWCAACVDLEEQSFRNPRVARHFENKEWELVRVDMTDPKSPGAQVAKQFNVVSLPSVFIANPQGNMCEAAKLFGFEDAAAFEARLERAKKDCL